MDDAHAVLTDRRALAVLGLTQSPRSAGDIARAGQIPIAGCYRIINRLLAAGLLRVAATRHGRRGGGRRVYVSVVGRVIVSFMGGVPRTEVVPRIIVDVAEWH